MNQLANLVGLCLLTSSVFAMAGDGSARSVHGPNLQIDLALTWLPEDTTTVIVSSVPGRMAQVKEGRPLADQIVWLSSIGLPSVNLKFAYRYIVDGARHNMAIKDLGLLKYEGCKIVGLEADEYRRLRQQAAQKSVRNGVVGGLTAFVFTDPNDPDKWTYYEAFDDGMMFCATDKPYLAEVLKRRAHPVPTRALPETLAQWQYIDKAAPLWAVEKFAPSNQPEARADLDDPKVAGIAVSMDDRKEKVTVISFSKSVDGFARASHLWGDYLRNEKAAPPLEILRVNGETTRIVLDAKAPMGDVPALMLLVILGHPVLI